jgi:hypothetical protein
MSVKENLIAARALIDTPEKWAKGGGDGISLHQAVDNTINEDDDAAYYAVTRALMAAMPDADKLPLVEWSWKIHRTHADVLALLDRAIAAQESQP